MRDQRWSIWKKRGKKGREYGRKEMMGNKDKR
jgi:hypothetical protein